MAEEPLLLITPNRAAMELLASLLDEQDDPDTIPAWTTTIPLTITKADLNRVMYGNGDLARIGFWVADRPMRCSRSPHSACRRSSDKARCVPRLLGARAWISSTMMVRVVASIARPDSEPRRT